MSNDPGVWLILIFCLFCAFMSGVSVTERRKDQWSYGVGVAFVALPFYLLFNWAFAV